MAILNKKLDNDTFFKIREEVLNQWPTGKEVNFEEAVAYHKAQPDSKVFAKKLAAAKASGETLIQPRAGVALPEEHLQLLQTLQNEGEADLLPSTIDAYTRHNRYNDCARGIEESRQAGRSLLNGFPAVNHGVQVCRHIINGLNVPVQVRHGTPDARLLTEITMAGGFSSYEGGGISYNIPYSKSIPLEKTLYDWQYCDRVIGMYEEAGVMIDREPYGPLTGTLVPPSVSHAVAIIEALLAAEQGVKNVTVGYGQCGNLVQDVAAIRTLESLTRYYLDLYGYTDVNVYTVFHQWMGGFPQDEAKAYGVISWGSATAAIAGATKVIVKTPHEAMGIPTAAANAAGLRTTKQLVVMLRDQKMIDTPDLIQEKEIIEAETKAMMEAVYRLGEGDLVQGVVRSFEAGVLDIPFAPSSQNLGKALPARDNRGAVRFLDTGNLPFSEDIKAFHKDKLEERAKAEGRHVSFQMAIDDVYAVSKGRLVGRP